MATMTSARGPATRRTRQLKPHASAHARTSDVSTESKYDLLTAALLGAAVGAGVTFLVRRGPSGRRPIEPLLDGAGRGLAWAGKNAAVVGSQGAHWAAERGEELWERIPRDRIRRAVRDQVEDARETIDDLVQRELGDLRRAIRKRRKQLGV